MFINGYNILTHQIGRMVAQTPSKRVNADGFESEGKKQKEKDNDLGEDDVQMTNAEEERQKWKPRPIDDPVGIFYEMRIMFRTEKPLMHFLTLKTPPTKIKKIQGIRLQK